MERTLRVINRLVEDGVLARYAIGGAMGALFYTEPFATYDLDIFVGLPSGPGGLVTLTPLYSALKNLGYEPKDECVIIEGVPVQFLPAYNDLVAEALREAVAKAYAETPTWALRAEYLMAIALQTGRNKDRERIRLFREQAEVDRAMLDGILHRHGLWDRWLEWAR